jgi:hypothetical protein
MPVSALEKNPERIMSVTRMEKSNPSGASFNAGLNLVGNIGFYLEEKAESGQAPQLALGGYLNAVQN